jgi:urease accessory protein
VHIHNVSGGILDIDSLEWEIEVGPDALAQVTSTGATRVYRSRSTAHVAKQRVTIRVLENGYLEYVPDQLIPFAGARFEQTTRIELAWSASLIWWEIIAPGREASGEIFRCDQLSSSLELIADDTPVAVEHWKLSPVPLGRFRHFASCYVCRAGEPLRYWRKLESELQNVTEPLCSPDVLWGVTLLRAHGLLIRGVAVSGRPLAAGLVEIWKAAKWLLCGRVATIPRKVH